MKKRRAMVEPNLELSMRRQCELLRVCRSSLYYQSAPVGLDELNLMRKLDELHLRYPFYGSRKLTQALKQEGLDINRKCIQRLMRLMEISAIAPKPSTSKPSPEHPVYPYLLRGLEITRPNQVWAADITYIPMERGFVYLVAIIDWHSRFVLSWQLSTSLETEFCVRALHDAFSKFGCPEIFNTDQGSQFTDATFTGELLKRKIKISMDGRGRFIDNIFVERLWRSLKYEEVYLHAYATVPEAREGVGRYFQFYNDERPHAALGYQTPAAFHRGANPQAA
jgi:putative transposase